MTEKDYLQSAQDFLDASDREFAAGDVRQGSEKLYGAANQVLTAIAKRRGWGYESHRDMKNATQRLADEYNTEAIITGFTAAEKFHKNFFHGAMEEYEIAIDRPSVHAYVRRLTAIFEAEAESAAD